MVVMNLNFSEGEHTEYLQKLKEKNAALPVVNLAFDPFLFNNRSFQDNRNLIKNVEVATINKGKKDSA